MSNAGGSIASPANPGEIRIPYNWRPRNYQMDCWKYFQGPEESKRGCEVWHRRAGKDLFAINLIGVKSQERVGLYWHVLPTYKQGRKIVWDGMTRDGRKFLDHLHPALVASTHTTEMKVTFKNGSIYQVVGTDDVDSLVGTNPIGVVFSEYSLQDPAAWDLIRPILAENGGWAMFIYTARGRNHGATMYDMAQTNPAWHCNRLVAGSGPNSTKRPDGRPVISDEVIEEERKAGMAEEMIQQEFFCSFDAPMVGAYYGTQMMLAEKQKRLVERIPHDPRLLVHTWWDLGMDDSTTIWFVQEVGTEVRLIDYYENAGEGLPHYARILKGQDDGDRGLIRSQYTYGTHLGPHDIEVRELSLGKSRRDVAKSLGINFKMCQMHEVQDGIEAVRALLPSCFFSMDRCARGVECLRQYRKEWDEKNKIFRNHPLHDWTSHGADSFRIGAWGRKAKMLSGRSKQPQNQADDYDYLNGRHTGGIYA